MTIFLCEVQFVKAPSRRLRPRASATRCLTQSGMNHTVWLPPHISEHCSLQSSFFFSFFFSLREHNTHTRAYAPYAAMSICRSRTVWDEVTKKCSVCSESWRKTSPVERLDSLARFFFFFLFLKITPVEPQRHRGDGCRTQRTEWLKEKKKKTCPVHLGLVSKVMGKQIFSEKRKWWCWGCRAKRAEGLKGGKVTTTMTNMTNITPDTIRIELNYRFSTLKYSNKTHTFRRSAYIHWTCMYEVTRSNKWNVNHCHTEQADIQNEC